jgi:hypothetical protein
VLPAAAQRLDYLTRFADRFGIASRSEGAPTWGWRNSSSGSGPPAMASRCCPRTCPRRPEPGVAAMPIVAPTSLYAWSLIWREDDRHPRLAELLESFGAAGRACRWLEFRPGADWLPEPDGLPRP